MGKPNSGSPIDCKGPTDFTGGPDATSLRRRRHLVSLLGCALVFPLVICFLDKDPVLARKVLMGLVCFLGGAGLGYGFKR
jgi:hypothetical protein